MKSPNPFSPSPYREPGRPLEPAASPQLDLLGLVEQEYRATRWRAPVAYYVAGLAVALVVFLVALLALGSGSHAGPGVFAFLALLLVAVGYVLAPASPHRVIIHDNGLMTHRGRNVAVILWDDVRHLLRDDRSGGGYLTLEDHAGRRIVFGDGVPTFTALADGLERRLSFPLIGPARAALIAGESLTFGAVTLDREGISVNGERVAWRDARVVRMGSTCALWKRDAIAPWANVLLERVPHPRVFLALLGEKVAMKTIGAKGGA